MEWTVKQLREYHKQTLNKQNKVNFKKCNNFYKEKGNEENMKMSKTQQMHDKFWKQRKCKKCKTSNTMMTIKKM